VVSVIQITLTALATGVGGALTLVVGQIIVRALEPALESKRLIKPNTPEEKTDPRRIDQT
jgi:hypothetical protein